MCGLTLFSKHLNHHMAIKHLLEKYLKNISSVPGYKTGMINDGVCPLCPWKATSEEVTGHSSEIQKSNKILLVKHYSDLHCQIDRLTP